jgi:drug/metabolite transporter (DMT)-like permease
MSGRINILGASAPVVFVLLWSSGFIGGKLGLPYADPLTFLAIRMALVVAILALIIWLSHAPWPRGRAWRDNAIAGLLIHGVYLGGVFIAIHLGLPAGIAALIVSLQPVLTSTLAGRWLGETVATVQWLGLALGLIGVYLVVHDKIGGDVSLAAIVAATVALAGITIGTLYQKQHNSAIDWRAGLFIQYAAAGLLFLCGALLFENRTVQWTGSFVFALSWLILVLSLGAVWLFYFLVRQSAATRVTSLFYLVPPTTAAMAYVLFGERLTVSAMVGFGVCVVGVFLVNWTRAVQT